MTYKVIDIEGVGDVYAEKLIAAGITTDAELLEKCAKPAGRKALAEATEISPKLILKWTNHCDLYRINGVGPQFAELLEASGVDTVKELKHRVAENLQKKLEEVNAQKNLTNRVPAVVEIQKMIDQVLRHETATINIDIDGSAMRSRQCPRNIYTSLDAKTRSLFWRLDNRPQK